MKRLNKDQLEFINGYLPVDMHDVYGERGSIYKDGGIHIKPSHVGMFTAYKKRTGKTTEEALHSPDPHVRQMATFAHNAAKWKHQEGGSAQSQEQQIMEVIKAVAKKTGVDPKSIIQKIQSLPEEQQSAYIQSLVKQVQGQAQMGGNPSQMQQAPQEMQVPQGQTPQESQSQQPDEQQIIQQIQEALKQGAKPEELITELLQGQIDPKMIVDIFVQLGMPKEQVVQEVQSILQQTQEGASQGQSGNNPATQQQGPSQQEQENPQEQQQEQGQEEPPMRYGGYPRFDNGGGYYEQTSQHTLNDLPNNGWTRGLMTANSFGDPNNLMQFLPDTGFAGKAKTIAGIGSLLSGSVLGYEKAFNPNKTSNRIEYDGMGNVTDQLHNGRSVYNKQLQQTNPFISSVDPNSPYKNHNSTPYSNPMQSSPIVGPQRFEDTIEGEQQRQYNDNQFNQGMDRFHDYMNRGFAYGGDIPHAQMGINWDSTIARLQGTPNIQNTIQSQMQSPQQDFNYHQPVATDYYNTHQLTPSTNVPKYSKNNNINKFSFNSYGDNLGQHVAINSINGGNMAANALSAMNNKSQYRNQNIYRGNSDNRFRSINTPDMYGDYTTNAPVASNYRLSNNGYAQDSGSNFAKVGGSVKFAEGGQYKVSEHQLLQLLKDGAQIDFL